MLFTSRINEALKLASHVHRNHVRKDKQLTPYISHLVAVAMLLQTVTDDEDIVIAGLMHDSLEDVPDYSYENLVLDCGNRVADIVKHVTEPLDANKRDDEQLPWLTRKEKYLENLHQGGAESAMVSASDKIHNTESFMRDMLHEKEEFLERFHSSLRNKLWFHEQVLLIVEEKLGKDHALVERLSKCTKEFENCIIQFEEVKTIPSV